MKGEEMKRWLFALPVMFLVLAACGGEDSDASASQSNDAVVITASDNEFDPAAISASEGSEIEVNNEGEAPHNFSVEGSGIDVDIEPGDSVTVDTSELEPGVYDVECKLHSGAGMTATLTLSE
jgi:plastocyanin